MSSHRREKKGGLALDHRAAMEEGGDSDDLFDFDHPGKSYLIKVLRHEEEDIEMPKDGAKLDGQVIADFMKWIAMGAPDPRDNPPSVEELERYLADTRPDRWGHLVDQFLASSRFGERWARHWMDWIRYADSHGSEGDPAINNAWRYRDYLIRALNENVSYDTLVIEHLAGDLLESPRIKDGRNESMLGTAHLRIVIWGGEFGRTPFSQGSDGRDHNPYGFSIWLAGGGFKGGSVYGATVLHQLGLDHEKLTYLYSGRNVRLTDVHGNVWKDLVT